jgi:hypothetical protein
MSQYTHELDQKTDFQALEELKIISYKVKHMVQGKGMNGTLYFHSISNRNAHKNGFKYVVINYPMVKEYKNNKSG